MSFVLPGRPVRSTATSAIAKTIALGEARRQSAEREMAIKRGDGSSRAYPGEWMPGAFPRRGDRPAIFGWQRAGTGLCSGQSATIMAPDGLAGLSAARGARKVALVAE
jgi:hypothetical protein